MDGDETQARRKAVYNAQRRDTAITLVTAVLLRWGMHMLARQMAVEIVNRLERAGYLKGVS